MRSGWDRLTEFERETRELYRPHFAGFKPPARMACRNEQWFVSIGRGRDKKPLDNRRTEMIPLEPQ